MAFKGGLSGWLGVGCAVGVVLVAIPIGYVVLLHGRAANTSSSPAPARRSERPGGQSQRARRLDLAVNDAAAVYSAYEKNAAKADVDMTNKWFAVKGKIHSIGTDTLHTPYIALDAGEGSTSLVQCMFSDADQDQVARLSPGQIVVIAGMCAGKSDNVTMRECWFYAPRVEAEQDQDQEKDASEQARTRAWTAADGQLIAQARLVKSDLTTVTLEKMDGTVINVPLEELCEADRTFVEQGGDKSAPR
jgi:hypothetical protein